MTEWTRATSGTRRRIHGRRLPIGAEYQGNGTTDVRVWAPVTKQAIACVLADGREVPLGDDGGGYFAGVVPASPGDRYRFRVDGGDRLYPDPASRFQPEGPHGPSQVVDPNALAWTDHTWRGASLPGQVIYELHIGTFTVEGTFAAAIERFDALVDLGVTAIEVMPVAEFHGRFGWGYDGVDLFAPSHLYGVPDDLRHFVDAAHARRLAVILDVVYNHFGPLGNYLRAYSSSYFADRESEWGESVNFDGPESGPVREFFLSNVEHWIREYHIDGLRLDATQEIHDRSGEHILTAIGRRAREAAGERAVVVVAEDEPQDTKLIRPSADGGYGLDGLWNDDFHHSALVALTGRAEGYYSDMTGSPQELISSIKYGSLFQGQFFSWQRQPRGRPALDIPPASFVMFLQNHDQIANASRGTRGHQLTSAARWRAMTALLLLAPGTPMLFQGQEIASPSPFCYFTDLDPDLADAIRQGRAEFLALFTTMAGFDPDTTFDDPLAPSTFERCKIRWADPLDAMQARVLALHRDLLRLRRDRPALTRQQRGAIDGCVLSASAFGVRFFAEDQSDDLVLLINLGVDLDRQSFAEPLLAPPEGHDWIVIWSSDDPRYGGAVVDLWPDDRWHVPGESAQLLAAGPPRSHGAARRRRTA